MSDMRVKTCVLGAVSTNCFLVYHDTTKEAVIIDPADNAHYILNKCSELGISPRAVLLTHGHFDHIMAAEDLRRAFHIKIYASETEDAMLADGGLNMSGSWGGMQTSFHADVLLKDGDELDLIGFCWKDRNAGSHIRVGLLLCSRGRGGLCRGHPVLRILWKDGPSNGKQQPDCGFHRKQGIPSAGRYHGISGTWGDNHHWP